MPQILVKVLATRKTAKAARTRAKTKSKDTTLPAAEQRRWAVVAAVMDGRQAALKIVANSVYGYCGAFIMRLLDIGAAVTFFGRQGIETTVRLIEAYFCRANGFASDCEVIYGDSVPGDTPVTLRDPETGKVWCGRIDRLVEREDEWETPLGAAKEIACPTNFPGLQVWSDQGWTPIHRVIRHRLPRGKTLHKVVTTGGDSVVVTSDHSLLRGRYRGITTRAGTGSNAADHLLAKVTASSGTRSRRMGRRCNNGR
jgi:hypothetical protein